MSQNPLKNVSEQLREQAVQLDACQRAMREWTDDPDALCEMYFRYLDFCQEHEFPSNDYLKTHFDGVIQRHGIYVDEQIDVADGRMMSCNGTTQGRIRYGAYDVGTVYARHDSVLDIHVADHACVFVRVYDRARVRVVNSGVGRVSVLHYGGEAAVAGAVAYKDLRAGAA